VNHHHPLHQEELTILLQLLQEELLLLHQFHLIMLLTV
jgi:hypothetical protein